MVVYLLIRLSVINYYKLLKRLFFLNSVVSLEIRTSLESQHSRKPFHIRCFILRHRSSMPKHSPKMETKLEGKRNKIYRMPSFLFWVVASVIFRLILIYFPKNLNLSSRPEVSTPLTSIRRCTVFSCPS